MITLCMLTKNAASHLKKALDSAVEFDEILILDNGSTDTTLSIAQSYPNVRLKHSPFIGFGPLRNFAASLAKHDWILMLDSDETISPALQKELVSLSLDPNCVYQILRHNFYNGKRIYGSNWNPDWVARLYHKQKTSYCNSQVHESLKTNHLQLVSLKGHLTHTPYASISDFLQKMEHYTSLFAEQNKGKRKSSFASALWHAFFSFFKSYFIKKGILDGTEGFIISFYNANTAFYKYLKLVEANKHLERVARRAISDF